MAQTISKAFMAAVSNAMFNGSEWKAAGEKVSLKDIWAATNPGLYENIQGDEAEVTETEFASGDIAYRITVPFKDGSSIDLKLSGRSVLEPGDKVKIDTIFGQELHKAGQDPIVRFDAELAE